jgi:hypothetical protein
MISACIVNIYRVSLFLNLTSKTDPLYGPILQTLSSKLSKPQTT